MARWSPVPCLGRKRGVALAAAQVHLSTMASLTGFSVIGAHRVIVLRCKMPLRALLAHSAV